MPLARDEIRAWYDRFGARQDMQAFYEDRAVDRLLANAALADAASVFEFGCGTGRLAERLLQGRLGPAAAYTGVDLSPVMVNLARARLARFGDRVAIHLTDGSLRFPVADHSIDRVLTTYVLDLLPEEDIRGFFAEARRVLSPGGRLGIASLTFGVGPWSRLMAGCWMRLYRWRPALVGGCRPIRLAPFAGDRWQIVHRHVVAPFGIPSEALVAVPRERPPAPAAG